MTAATSSTAAASTRFGSGRSHRRRCSHSMRQTARPVSSARPAQTRRVDTDAARRNPSSRNRGVLRKSTLRPVNLSAFISRTLLAPRSAQAAAGLEGRTCRQEWRHGTQECVRHVLRRRSRPVASTQVRYGERRAEYPSCRIAALRGGRGGRTWGNPSSPVRRAATGSWPAPAAC